MGKSLIDGGSVDVGCGHDVFSSPYARRGPPQTVRYASAPLREWRPAPLPRPILCPGAQRPDSSEWSPSSSSANYKHWLCTIVEWMRRAIIGALMPGAPEQDS
jgi:hypothetical protein